MQLLRAAGSRLRRPKLAASFDKWQRDWEAEMFVQKQMSQAELQSVGLAMGHEKRMLERQLVVEEFVARRMRL